MRIDKTKKPVLIADKPDALGFYKLVEEIDDLMIPEDKMEKWFKKRQNMHIKSVIKWYDLVIGYAGVDRISISDHDKSKFSEPEHTSYVFTTWNSYCKRNKIDFTLTKEQKDASNIAIIHHITKNKHHPEFWDSAFSPEMFNHDSRDELPEKMVNATKMPMERVAEMVADWSAVSEELKTHPKIWADKNTNKRWRFAKEQSDFIYDIINNKQEKQK